MLTLPSIMMSLMIVLVTDSDGDDDDNDDDDGDGGGGGDNCDANDGDSYDENYEFENNLVVAKLTMMTTKATYILN